MVELERNVVPELSLKINTLKHYVDDTIAYKNTKIKCFNEIQDIGEIVFLNVLLVRKGNNIETTVYG